ncbi:MAG: VanW family protein [Candidatus Caenarcaniphilales bacterium]|nr:VanW family protein [Candidatus Caenarcaniphilales bacterium]
MKHKDLLLLILSLFIGLGVYLYLQVNDPFNVVLVERVISTKILNQAQKANLRQAVHYLQGVVIERGEIFSFNDAVGERSEKRGFLPARTYLDKDSPDSLGGGICAIASAIYQSALMLNLEIVERHPHTRRTQSIPTGLDATIWYGKADLRFRNNTAEKIKLNLTENHGSITIQLLGSKKIPLSKLSRHQIKSLEGVMVEVYSQAENHTPSPSSARSASTHLISRDLYL